MKLNYFVLFILLFPSSFFAQDYIPLVVEDKHWVYKVCEGNQGVPFASFYEYLLRGDTLINNQTYKKIFRRDFQIPETDYLCDFVEQGVSKPYVITNSTYIGGVRENIEQKKVWLLPSTGNSWFNCYENGEEQLIFDFAQELGDSIVFCPDNPIAPGLDTLTLQSSGELADFYGERKKNCYESEYCIYEGIGNRFGLEMASRLFLIIDDGYYGLFDFCIGTDFECLFDNTAVHNILPTESVKIIPSPSNGNFSLQLEKEIEKNTTLQIINSQGSILFKEAVNNQNHSVNTDLPTGLYFLSLLENGKQIWSGKTIIKD